MDGGEKERDERQRVKAAVRKSFKRRRARQSRAHKERPGARGREHAPHSALQDSSSSERDSMSADGDSEYGENEEMQQAGASAIVDASDYTARGSGAHHHLPMTSLFARPFPYEESSLLMHYLDHVFPLQYFYHSEKTWARGWLLWLLSKNGPLYRASLGLAALHLRSLHRGSEEPNFEIEYHTGALRELQEFIARFEAGESQGGDELLVEVIACGAALVSFEVLKGSTNNWQPHLYGSASILNSMNHQHLLSKPPATIHDPLRQHTGTDAALAFHVPVILWMDILACVSTRQKPKLPYTTWLSQGSSIDLESMMGCQNWAMKCIGDLGVLDEWKISALAVETFDADEFETRCNRIEDELENGLEALQMAVLKETSTPTRDSLVTRIFTTAALVQLHIIKADVSSSWSPKLLHRAVTRVMREIQAPDESPSARRIIWPICIAGSVANPGQRPFFENLIRDVLHRAGGMVGNSGTVLDIMEQCWSFQAEEPDVLWECSSTMMKMGISALLI